MDDEVRRLERAARGGDPDAVARLAAMRCKLGRHDYRCDRLCADCGRQRSGLSFLPAMTAGAGHGAVGWMKGYALARGMGTMKGLPRLGRKQGMVKVRFRDAYWSERFPNRGPRQGRVFTPEEWDPPREAVPWSDIHNARLIAVNRQRRIICTPWDLIARLTWEPFCQECHGAGYLKADVRISQGSPWSDPPMFAPCDGCKLGLTQQMIEANKEAEKMLYEHGGSVGPMQWFSHAVRED